MECAKSHTGYCPYLLVVLSKGAEVTLGPQLDPLVSLSYSTGLIPLLPSDKVIITLLVGLCDLCELAVLAKTPPKSNIIGLHDLVLFALVTIIYYLLVVRGI